MTSFLRSLSAEQQVSLLFVLLFGVLMIATAVGILLSMRDYKAAVADQRSQQLHDYNALLRSSWLMALVFWIGWAAGEGVAIVLFGGV
jgi:phosphatidate cytidylyltransferase